MGIKHRMDGVFMYRYKFRPWETAALLALCITLLSGTWAASRQQRLASGLIRLHVIAVSDEESEQALKLRVRDAVLRYLRPRLASAADAEAARELLEQVLPGVKAAAEQVSEGRSVSVSLGPEDYPLRSYGGFRLPAGRYESLRVVLGDGAGHNWWCVVFPALCLGAVEAEDLESALDGEDLALVTQAEGYAIRFWLVDAWGALMNRLRS